MVQVSKVWQIHLILVPHRTDILSYICLPQQRYKVTKIKHTDVLGKYNYNDVSIVYRD
jgi:hypothetical protein